MNVLIPINYDAEQPTVSARDLHKALNVQSRFSRWFNTNKELFIEGEDFNKCTSSTVVNNGATVLPGHVYSSHTLSDTFVSITTMLLVCSPIASPGLSCLLCCL